MKISFAIFFHLWLPNIVCSLYLAHLDLDFGQRPSVNYVWLGIVLRVQSVEPAQSCDTKKKTYCIE